MKQHIELRCFVVLAIFVLLVTATHTHAQSPDDVPLLACGEVNGMIFGVSLFVDYKVGSHCAATKNEVEEKILNAVIELEVSQSFICAGCPEPAIQEGCEESVGHIRHLKPPHIVLDESGWRMRENADGTFDWCYTAGDDTREVIRIWAEAFGYCTSCRYTYGVDNGNCADDISNFNVADHHEEEHYQPRSAQ